jgi:hypothetical protein
MGAVKNFFVFSQATRKSDEFIEGLGHSYCCYVRDHELSFSSQARRQALQERGGGAKRDKSTAFIITSILSGEIPRLIKFSRKE